MKNYVHHLLAPLLLCAFALTAFGQFSNTVPGAITGSSGFNTNPPAAITNTPSFNTNPPAALPQPISIWAGTNANPNGIYTAGFGSIYNQFDVLTGTNFLAQWIHEASSGNSDWVAAGGISLANTYYVLNTNEIIVNTNLTGYPWVGGVGVLTTYTDWYDGSTELEYTNQNWSDRFTYVYDSPPGQWIVATSTVPNIITNYLADAYGSRVVNGGIAPIPTGQFDAIGAYSGGVNLTTPFSGISPGGIVYGYYSFTNSVVVSGISNQASVYIDPINGNDTNGVFGYINSPLRTVASAMAKGAGSGWNWFFADGTNDFSYFLWNPTNAAIYAHSQKTIFYGGSPNLQPFLQPAGTFLMTSGEILTGFGTNFSWLVSNPPFDFSFCSNYCNFFGVKILSAYGCIQGGGIGTQPKCNFLIDDCDISGGTFNIEINDPNDYAIVKNTFVHPQYNAVFAQNSSSAIVNIAGIDVTAGIISGCVVQAPVVTNAVNGFFPMTNTGVIKLINSGAYGNKIQISGTVLDLFSSSNSVWFNKNQMTLFSPASNCIVPYATYDTNWMWGGTPQYSGTPQGGQTVASIMYTNTADTHGFTNFFQYGVLIQTVPF